jgi:hypothetical protein
MAVKQPAFWLRYDQRLVPSGTATYRWSNRPYADVPTVGGFKEGRILDFGVINRYLTDYLGNYRNSGFRCQLTDLDRFFRILLGTDASRFMINREIAIELLSDIARAAGVATPRCVYRGVVNNHPLTSGLRMGLEGEDYIGSTFSPLSLNKMIPYRTWNRDDFPNMHRDLVGTPQQIPYGEISDEGAVDEDGLNAEKGRHPVIWLGYDESIGYHVFGIAGCAIKSINQWYASDLATDTSPDRVRQAEDTAGVDFLLPGWPGWPHPENYVEVNGQRMTIMYAAGGVADHHIEGLVNITLNICGIEDVGDGSGEVIDTAFVMLQHLFEQWIIPNNGKGYYTGNWASPPLWPTSGFSIVKSTSFAEAQDQTKLFLSDSVGYKTVFDITSQETVRDIIRYACVSFNCYIGTDWNGRLIVKVLNDLPDPEEGMLVRDNIEAIQVNPPEYAFSECENKITYQYAWDNDKERYSADLETIESLTAQEEIGQVYEPQSPHPLRMVGHTATARDSMARRLLRLKYPPKYSRILLNLCGLDMDLGDQFRLTAIAEGLGDSGYVAKPFFIMGTQLNPSKGQVELTGLDLEVFTGVDTLSVVLDSALPESEIPADGWELR